MGARTPPAPPPQLRPCIKPFVRLNMAIRVAAGFWYHIRIYWVTLLRFNGGKGEEAFVYKCNVCMLCVYEDTCISYK